jgi:hypothetical protein
MGVFYLVKGGNIALLSNSKDISWNAIWFISVVDHGVDFANHLIVTWVN